MEYINDIDSSLIFGNYYSLTQEKFKNYFLRRVECLIKDHLDIDIPDDAKLESYTKVSLDFLESYVFVKIKKLISISKSYLKVEALKLSDNISTKGYEIDKIKLTRSNVNKLVQYILILFVTKTIEEEENSSALNDKTELKLGNFLTSIEADDKTFFNIEIKLKDFLYALRKEYQREQFAFWFLFFIPNFCINITSYAYEYFLIDYNIVSDIRLKVLLDEYLIITNYIIKVRGTSNIIDKRRNIHNIYLILHPNVSITEEEFEEISKDFEKFQDRYNSDCPNVKFNHLILHISTKCSPDLLEEFLINNSKFNNICSLSICLKHFSHYEYSLLSNQDDKLISYLVDNFTSLMQTLKDLINSIKNKSLLLLCVIVEGFKSHKSYLNAISETLDSFVSFTNFLSMKMNLVYHYTDLDQEEFAQVPTLKMNKDLKVIYTDPGINFNIQACVQKLEGKKFLNLVLFEKNLEILKNKALDFYFLSKHKFSYKKLKLGLFKNFDDLTNFVPKLKNFTEVTKLYLYCNSNKGFVYENMKSFFANFKKIETLKVIFETTNHYEDFDLFTLYTEHISKLKCNHKDFQYGRILFIKAENHLLYCLNDWSLNYIFNDLQGNNEFNKDLHSRRLRDRFYDNIIITDKNYQAIVKVLTALKGKNGVPIINHLNARLKFKRKDITLIQHIFSFIPGKNIIFKDFNGSDKIFEYYYDVISKSF